MTYISVADVNAEGLNDPPYTDALILAAITTWQAFLERACRQWFESRALTLYADGTDSDAIHFGVPIIAIEYVKLNGDTVALGTDYYRAYNGRSYPDDRRNPRIKLVRSDSNFDIYTQPMIEGQLIFRKGRQNQEIKGTFGFLEDDDTTPQLIQRALMLLVIEKLTHPLYGDPDAAAAPPLVGAVIDEWTDGHKIKNQPAGGEINPRAPGLVGITNNQEILDIIKLYKAPIGIATPNGWSYDRN